MRALGLYDLLPGLRVQDNALAQGAMTYQEFREAIKARGFSIDSVFDPGGSGKLRFVVTGAINGMPFKMENSVSLLPSQDYRPILDGFWDGISDYVSKGMQGQA